MVRRATAHASPPRRRRRRAAARRANRRRRAGRCRPTLMSERDRMRVDLAALQAQVDTLRTTAGRPRRRARRSCRPTPMRASPAPRRSIRTLLARAPAAPCRRTSCCACACRASRRARRGAIWRCRVRRPSRRAASCWSATAAATSSAPRCSASRTRRGRSDRRLALRLRRRRLERLSAAQPATDAGSGVGDRLCDARRVGRCRRCARAARSPPASAAVRRDSLPSVMSVGTPFCASTARSRRLVVDVVLPAELGDHALAPR